MMRNVHSTDLESSSQTPAWIVLVFCAVVLVMFFSWIVKDLSVLVFSDQRSSWTDQQLPDGQRISGGGVPDNSNNAANDMAVSRVDRQASTDSSLALNSDRHGTVQSSKTTVESASNTISQPIQDVADQPADVTPDKDGAPAGSDANQQAVTQESPERFYYRQPSVELPPYTRNGQRAATQEQGTIADRIDDDEVRSSSMWSLEPEGVVLPQNSTTQTDKAEPAKTTTANPELSNTQPPSADLEALRQLIAEATAIDTTEDESALATRDRSEALKSLPALSAAIRFTPGSKAASEPVITTLKQIATILTDYPDTMVSVLVATNENGNDRQDALLSQERGRALIAKLVNSGVAFSRFSLQAQIDDQLPANTHRVSIQAYLKS